MLNRCDHKEDRPPNSVIVKEDDANVLVDDVKQIVTTIVEQAISTFENQLRPIDRYTIHNVGSNYR